MIKLKKSYFPIGKIRSIRSMILDHQIKIFSKKFSFLNNKQLPYSPVY